MFEVLYRDGLYQNDTLCGLAEDIINYHDDEKDYDFLGLDCPTYTDEIIVEHPIPEFMYQQIREYVRVSVDGLQDLHEAEKELQMENNERYKEG